MRFVNLTDYIPQKGTCIEKNEIQAKILKNKPSYKLENAKGLIWAFPERNDEFYSEWETCQPHTNKYAIYYEIGKDSQVIKPKELFGIRNQMEYDLNQDQGNNLKENILNYIRRKYNNPSLNHVICEVTDSMDVANLHTLFNTSDVEKIVEGYAKSFSAMYWNFIDDKDEYCFQVPSLMIMDSECMKTDQIIETISHQRRKLGVDKITRESNIELNPHEFKKLIGGEKNLENAVNLLTIKEIMGDYNLSMLIDQELSNFEQLKDAEQILEQDKIAEELYMIMPEDKTKITNEILSNKDMQKELEFNRMNHTGKIDYYMAAYVNMLEEFNNQKYIRTKNQEKEVSVENQSNVDNLQKQEYDGEDR